MKKTASKAPKTSAKAKPTPVQAKTPAQTKSAAVPAPKVAKPAKAVLAAVKTAPAVKAPAPEAIVVTSVVAQVDVGFGNALYIRGEGAGLSWDKGIALENIAADRWEIALQGATTPVVFKFLINDQTWSLGEDYIVSPGSTLALVPIF